MNFTLTDTEKKLLLKTARESIASFFEGKKGIYGKPSEKVQTPLGAFVTLHINGHLRGCIGHMMPVYPLFTGIQHLARESAFHDPRFSPLTKAELSQADIEISVLSPLKRIDSVDTIKVGTHGILMRNGSYSGVLLPQVPVEQGWDLEAFLINTCYKAGIPGNCWKDPDTEIEIFSAVVFGEKDQGLFPPSGVRT